MKHEDQPLCVRLYYAVLMADTLVRWWWNGRWGRLARQDVKIYSDGAAWRVEAWQGGTEGRCRTWELADEAACQALADDLMSDSDGWRDMEPTRR